MDTFDEIDIHSRREQRRFGLVMAAAVAVLGLLRWGFHSWRAGEMGGPPWLFIDIAALMALAGLATPGLLMPLLAGWLKLALALNWFMTRATLAVVFYGLITPMGAVMSLLGKDPLKRRWKPDAPTYWEPAESQTDGASGHRNALIELGAFLWARKLFWLAPVVLALVLLGLLMLVSGSASILSPFLYAL